MAILLLFIINPILQHLQQQMSHSSGLRTLAVVGTNCRRIGDEDGIAMAAETALQTLTNTTALL